CYRDWSSDVCSSDLFFMMPEQLQHAIPNQIGGCLLPTHHGDDRVGDYLFVRKAISIHLRSEERLNQTFSWVLADLRDGSLKIPRSEERRVGKGHKLR